jgi:endonuclease III
VKTSVRKTRGRQLRQALGILEKKLGRRRRRRPPDPLETLLVSVLAGDGDDLLAAEILEKLRAELVDWNELRVSTGREIEELIVPLSDAVEKALALKRILQKLFVERHTLNLSHFQRFGRERLDKELDAFGGLSPTVKARMMLKAFDINVLPMTADIERIVKRLGLVDNYLTTDKVAEDLSEVLPPKRVYSFYHLMSEHAERVCSVRNYDCTKCLLVAVCERGRSSKSGDDK